MAAPTEKLVFVEDLDEHERLVAVRPFTTGTSLSCCVVRHRERPCKPPLNLAAFPSVEQLAAWFGQFGQHLLHERHVTVSACGPRTEQRSERVRRVRSWLQTVNLLRFCAVSCPSLTNVDDFHHFYSLSFRFGTRQQTRGWRWQPCGSAKDLVYCPGPCAQRFDFARRSGAVFDRKSAHILLLNVNFENETREVATREVATNLE